MNREFNQVLIVEGKNDKHVFFALFKEFEVIKNFDVVELTGWDQAIKKFNASIIDTESNNSTIGLIVDADIDIESRWQSIKTKLSDLYYDIPSCLSEAGIILTSEEYPKIGIWIMPNCKNNGMLENFLLEMIEMNAPETNSYVSNVVDNAKKDGFTTFKELHKDKAIIHTWLSWQDEPGRPLGQSITAKIIRPETETVQKFICWITRLFN